MSNWESSRALVVPCEIYRREGYTQVQYFSDVCAQTSYILQAQHKEPKPEQYNPNGPLHERERRIIGAAGKIHCIQRDKSTVVVPLSNVS